ncbi:MAG: FtsX-like permease family protein [Bacteroidales bacterium]|nr:FtsX-like permease family protein [Bacteroidales bacterium]
MIKFLFKGLMRDRHRSFLPAIVTALGVFLTVVFYCYITGIMGDTIEMSARFESGHVKVMSRAYLENKNQNPIDLALLGAEDIITELEEMNPDMAWAERIRFGGLLDIPDENGDTKSQGTAMGMGVDLLSENTMEVERLNILQAIKTGTIPSKPGEILISNQFAEKLEVNIGDDATLISSNMDGGMAFYNFTIVGTFAFGTNALDKGMIIADIEDVRMALGMYDATAEILGFFPSGYYESELAEEITNTYNLSKEIDPDRFAPVMVTLKEENSMGQILDLADAMGFFMVFLFIVAMSIVLWNAGLIGGLRRYGEFGLRLAIGEAKGHVYKTQIMESVLVGLIGSVVGTIFGLLLSYWMQEHGINVESFMKTSSMMMPNVFKSRITPTAFWIGFIPGLFSSVLGTMLSGIGIYKRSTAKLFKELEH